RIVVAKYLVVARGADESVVVLCEVIGAEFLVVAELQLPDNCAQRDLRRLDVHFVQNLFDLYHHLAISENDDGIGALIGNELGVSDRDRLWSGVYRLRGKLLGNVQRAAATACRAGRATRAGQVRETAAPAAMRDSDRAGVADSRQAARRHRAPHRRLQYPVQSTPEP